MSSSSAFHAGLNGNMPNILMVDFRFLANTLVLQMISSFEFFGEERGRKGERLTLNAVKW